MAIERAVQGLAEAEGLLTEASRRASRHAVTDVVASQPLMSVAEETCLMMREGPRIASAAMETRLYLHGPMDCAGDTAHIILGGERESLLADQLAERADDIVFITGSDGPAPTTRKALTIRMPSPCADYPANILAAVFLAQGIVIGASEERGIDMDAAAFRRLDTKVTQVPR
jgi:glucosamine--fructose-6-phosphate aminotransferase (isomerizing)